jgi:hypothetical protein
MKKIFFATMFVLVAINLDASQDSLFINRYLNNLPQFQTVTVYEEDSLVAAKGAELRPKNQRSSATILKKRKNKNRTL